MERINLRGIKSVTIETKPEDDSSIFWQPIKLINYKKNEFHSSFFTSLEEKISDEELELILNNSMEKNLRIFIFYFYEENEDLNLFNPNYNRQIKEYNKRRRCKVIDGYIKERFAE